MNSRDNFLRRGVGGSYYSVSNLEEGSYQNVGNPYLGGRAIYENVPVCSSSVCDLSAAATSSRHVTSRHVASRHVASTNSGHFRARLGSGTLSHRILNNFPGSVCSSVAHLSPGSRGAVVEVDCDNDSSCSDYDNVPKNNCLPRITSPVVSGNVTQSSDAVVRSKVAMGVGGAARRCGTFSVMIDVDKAPNAVVRPKVAMGVSGQSRRQTAESSNLDQARIAAVKRSRLLKDIRAAEKASSLADEALRELRTQANVSQVSPYAVSDVSDIINRHRSGQGEYDTPDCASSRITSISGDRNLPVIPQVRARSYTSHQCVGSPRDEDTIFRYNGDHISDINFHLLAMKNQLKEIKRSESKSKKGIFSTVKGWFK